MAEALQQLGVKAAWVVHGSGCDEIALHGVTNVSAVTSTGAIEHFELTPADFGLPQISLSELTGGSPADNAKATLAILQGTGQTAHNQAVAANVAAMLHISGADKERKDLKQLTQSVLEHLASGQAFSTLTQLRELSHG